jgi:hypothetical protein
VDTGSFIGMIYRAALALHTGYRLGSNIGPGSMVRYDYPKREDRSCSFPCSCIPGEGGRGEKRGKEGGGLGVFDLLTVDDDYTAVTDIFTMIAKLRMSFQSAQRDSKPHNHILTGAKDRIPSWYTGL